MPIIFDKNLIDNNGSFINVDKNINSFNSRIKPSTSTEHHYHPEPQQKQQQTLLPQGLRKNCFKENDKMNEIDDGNVPDHSNSLNNIDIINDNVDFQFANYWQIYIQTNPDKNIHSCNCNNNKDTATENLSNWNIKPFGLRTNSAKEFWSTYLRLYEMDNIKNVMIFKDNIEPKWEHECNIGGGRWYIDIYNDSHNLNRNDIAPNNLLQMQRDFLLRPNCWTQCMQVIMSNSVGLLNHLIVGIILTFKLNKYRVSFWTRSNTDFHQIIDVGIQLQKYLNFRSQIKFDFHTDSTNTFNDLIINCSEMKIE